ncbi:DUF6514 family protein [Dysosmobacter sp.]
MSYWRRSWETSEKTTAYGILVESGQEREAIRGITLSQRRVETLLCTLIRGGVTAVTARDVVEDWLLA